MPTSDSPYGIVCHKFAIPRKQAWQGTLELAKARSVPIEIAVFEDRLTDRDGYHNLGTGTRAAADLHFAIEQARALLHADQPKAMRVNTGPWRACLLWVEAAAIVGDD